MGGRSVKLDAYIRVSKVGGRSGDSFISPDAQRDVIAAWAEHNAVRIVEWHEDLDQSGRKLNRPAFDRMLARVRARQTEGVVVAKIDRFARSLVGATKALQAIDAAGAVFFSVQDGADVPTSAGRLHQRMMLSLAEFELDRITENWDTSRERAVGRGAHIGVTPFGYVKQKHGGRLIPAPTAELMTEAFSMRASSRKLVEISDFLNRHAKPGRAAQFMPRTVSAMLGRRVYLGELRHGAFFQANAHEPLTDPETFELAQGKHRSTSPAEKHMLVGLVRCANCRYVLNYRHGKQFRCSIHHAAGSCDGPVSALASELETFVTDALLERLPELASGADLLDSKIAVETAESALIAYRDDLDLQALLKHADYVGGLATRQRSLETARSRYSASLTHAYGIDTVSTLERWESMPKLERRAAAHQLIEAVFVRPGSPASENFTIVWKGEHVELPSRGSGKYAPTPFRW
jgi:site-specific DNA recombinase